MALSFSPKCSPACGWPLLPQGRIAGSHSTPCPPGTPGPSPLEEMQHSQLTLTCAGSISCFPKSQLPAAEFRRPREAVPTHRVSLTQKPHFLGPHSPVGQEPCSQVLHRTLVEEEEVEKEEKEKLLLGLVEKVLQRVVGVVEMHSLKRNFHPPQVEEEVAVAGL